jgi:hypothetical protein
LDAHFHIYEAFGPTISGPQGEKVLPRDDEVVGNLEDEVVLARAALVRDRCPWGDLGPVPIRANVVIDGHSDHQTGTTRRQIDRLPK